MEDDLDTLIEALAAVSGLPTDQIRQAIERAEEAEHKLMLVRLTGVHAHRYITWAMRMNYSNDPIMKN